MTKDKDNNTTCFFDLKNKEINSSDITIHLSSKINLCWPTFEDLIKIEYGICQTKFVGNNIDKATCTCVYYKKNYICTHILGIAARMNWILVPKEVSSLLLEKKRGPGRPSKVGNAYSIN